MVALVVAVVTLPVAAAVVLLAAGARVPAPGPVLVLAMVAALSINRSVFFPSEQAATAEVAVVLVAVTGFASSAPWLGPLAVALLVGPLDMSHWERRSFVRMAYNAGNRGLAGLSATAAFALIGTHVGVVLGAVGAATAFVIVDVAVSTALLVAQGTTGRVAAARVVTIDRFALPLAISGAAIGFLVDAAGWWAAALALAPLAFVPEQLIVRRSRPDVRARTWWIGAIVAGGAVCSAVLWLLLPTSTLAPSFALLTIGVLVGVELDVDADGRPSPLVVVVVVAAAVVLPGDRASVLAPLAAVAGCATTWWCTSRRPTARVAVATSATVALAATGIVAGSTALAPLGPVVGATLVAIVLTFVVVVVVERRVAPVTAFAWSAPVVAVAAAIAGVWGVLGPGGGALLVCWLGATAIAARSFGAPPWPGRVTAHVRPRGAGHRLGLVLAAVAVAVSATVAMASTEPDVRTGGAWLAVAVAESAAAVVLVGIRQWRLAPAARRRTAGLAAASAVASIAAGAALADGRHWAGLLLVASAAGLVAAGWRPARCVDAVDRAARPGDRR